MVGGAIAVGIIGLAFVLSAPLDDSARTSLGTGLITGLIVGIAVAAMQWMVERRREGHEQDIKEQQCATMYEVARSRLGRLIAAQIWTYWQLLLPYVGNVGNVGKPPPLETENPHGDQDEDVRNIQRTLQWLREKMGREMFWWKDTPLLVTADALSFVATDLLERIGFPASHGKGWSPENDPAIQSLQEVRVRTVQRLASIAERLADAGDIHRAFAVDTQVDAFESNQPMTTSTPDLGEFRTRAGVPMIGKRSLSDTQQEVGWLVDQLRPDPVTGNEYGVPVSPQTATALEYRWGRLFKPGENQSTVWDHRFASGSWLRSIFDRASKELPAMFGLKPRDTN
jgi:hypothetical protein